MPPEVVGFMEKIALDPSLRRGAMKQSWGDRLSERWLDFKMARWEECSKPEAVPGYARLEVATCDGAGHYPMQETPVSLAALIERFLAG